MTAKRKDYLSWDEYFMAVALLSAQRSKDPNTQVGACVANRQNKIVGLGYNGFPWGISDDDLPWERSGDFLETKYPYVCHAELNAVLNAISRDLRGGAENELIILPSSKHQIPAVSAQPETEPGQLLMFKKEVRLNDSIHSTFQTNVAQIRCQPIGYVLHGRYPSTVTLKQSSLAVEVSPPITIQSFSDSISATPFCQRIWRMPLSLKVNTIHEYVSGNKPDLTSRTCKNGTIIPYAFDELVVMPCELFSQMSDEISFLHLIFQIEKRGANASLSALKDKIRPGRLIGANTLFFRTPEDVTFFTSSFSLFK
ncbi:unnamed protein product [Cyprideis torosa]|uniref:dCMP deaminase n=1 Tax=Cyprideis torosa TaxID=163714 RepID=A0A7R8WUB4_9CRUS|nr:unnamed protein product [Cyprideis torosa]CAG0906467.1 unnamed protein product [Cyprideis torosa]